MQCVENVRVAGMESEAWLVQRGCAKPKGIVVDYKMARSRHGCGGAYRDIIMAKGTIVSSDLEPSMTLVVLILVPSSFAARIASV